VSGPVTSTSPEPARADAGSLAIAGDGLRLTYPGAEEPALLDLTIRVPRGARIALVGANGSGKSTLLRILAGVLRPSGGQVRVLGEQPARVRTRTAYMAQRAEVDWQFPISVRQLAMSGRAARLGWRRRPRAEDRRIVADELARVGLTSLSDRRIADLSGGQRQRLLLARALAERAELLLLDEPDAAMDHEGQELVWSVLLEASRAAQTAVVATHSTDHLDGRVDGALYLDDGRECDPGPRAFRGLRVGTR
jgi:ABC-type Mn2+/Zn2+ transport system ATPase subunit